MWQAGRTALLDRDVAHTEHAAKTRGPAVSRPVPRPPGFGYSVRRPVRRRIRTTLVGLGLVALMGLTTWAVASISGLAGAGLPVAHGRGILAAPRGERASSASEPRAGSSGVEVAELGGIREGIARPGWVMPIPPPNRTRTFRPAKRPTALTSRPDPAGAGTAKLARQPSPRRRDGPDGRRAGAGLPFGHLVPGSDMRLYRPAPGTGRVALAPDEVGGHRLEAGSIVILSMWATHRNRDLWPDPQRFDPSRFAPGAVARRHRYAYVPFGGGPRACLGALFARLEATVAVAALVRAFRLTTDQVEPAVAAGITLRPRGAVPCSISALAPSSR